MAGVSPETRDAIKPQYARSQGLFALLPTHRTPNPRCRVSCCLRPPRRWHRDGTATSRSWAGRGRAQGDGAPSCRATRLHRDSYVGKIPCPRRKSKRKSECRWAGSRVPGRAWPLHTGSGALLPAQTLAGPALEIFYDLREERGLSSGKGVTPKSTHTRTETSRVPV